MFKWQRVKREKIAEETKTVESYRDLSLTIERLGDIVLSGKLDDAPFVSLFGDEPHWKGGPSAHCLI